MNGILRLPQNLNLTATLAASSTASQGCARFVMNGILRLPPNLNLTATLAASVQPARALHVLL
jgi:hypothetical protein